MQRLLGEKVMAVESRNGGSALTPVDGKDTGQRKVLIFLDLFCLFLGTVLHSTHCSGLLTTLLVGYYSLPLMIEFRQRYPW